MKKTPYISGLTILFICLSGLTLLFAEEISQNLNIKFDFQEYKNVNPYCSENYTFAMYIRWTPPPQGNVCYYSVYRNGVRLGTTGGSPYFIVGSNGCFGGGYPAFKAGVDNLLNAYYYNNNYKIVAERNCYGLPSLADQISIGDEASIQEASRPSSKKQLPQEKTKTVGEPINVASGNMFTSLTDIFIPSKEIPLALSRTYNSADGFNGQFGFGWRSDFDVSLKEYPHGVVVETDENSVYTVYSQSVVDGSYRVSAGKYSILTKNPDFTYTILRKHGQKLCFDVYGRLVKIEGRNGNALNIVRNYDGKITEVSDSLGRKLLFTLDSLGRTTQVNDPTNRVWKYEYDTNGNLVKTTDPLDNITTDQYDGNHRLIQTTDPKDHSLYFEYDASGRAYHSWQDGNKNEVSLSFDPASSVTTVTDSRGAATTYEYNDYGLVTKTTNALNNTQLSVWDVNLNRISSTDQNGHIVTSAYDDRGNLLSITDPLSNTTVFTYIPDFDFIKTVTDAQGNVTTNDYDAKGNLIKLTDALGNFTTNAYDALGQMTSTTDSLNSTTSFTYDSHGNLLTTTDALNNITTFTYDVLGNRTEIKDTQNNISRFIYNNLNQLIQVTYPDNSTVSYNYDALGNKISFTDSASNTFSYTYDLNNKMTSMSNPLGLTTLFVYDTEGNLIKVTDQDLHDTNYQYDALNRVISEIDPLGKTRTYVYDTVGNRTGMTDENGNTMSYEYDSLNLLKKVNYPMGSVAFEYDSLGRRTLMNDSQGATAYVYDKLSRLTQVDGPGQNDTLQYGYDALGNRTTLMLPDGKIVQYSYDTLSRLASITDSNNKTTTYTYDNVGNPINVIYPNGIQANHAFDALHRLTRLINQNQSTLEKLSEFGYTYDQAGRRVRVELFDGTIDYQYDAVGQLTREAKSSGSNQYQISFEYDSAGNRTRMIKDGKERLYSYNAANQLTQEQINGPSAWPITLTGTATDANGIQSVTVNGTNATLDGNNFACNINLFSGLNVITVTATDVAGNSTTKSINVTYVQSSQIVYVYDNNGSLISKQSVDQILNLSYDYENRLKTITSDSMNIAYGYDGEGKRILKQINGQATTYLYDTEDIILEQSSEGITYYTHGFGIDNLLSMLKADKEYYYLMDGLGSVANIADSSGQAAQSYQYDAFGNILSTQTNLKNSYTFTTREFDSESSFYYYRNRYYDAGIGRFITQDPAGMIDGYNLYAYCSSDPINFIDPYGLFRFGKRPLQKNLWFFGISSNPLDDFSNTEFSHEHGFFEDGSGYNRGWGPEGTFFEDPTGLRYRYENKHYDDTLMRLALVKLEKQYKKQKYRLIGNNCQNFTNRWRDIYKELKNEQDRACKKKKKR